MVVNHNIPALHTHLSMRRSDRGVQQAMQRLSSGMRINSAREDAAGLAIANRLNFQVGGLTKASQNATHGISLIQTAEGALTEVHNMLQRMRELSVQAAHGVYNDDQRAMIQSEIEQLTLEIHSISRNTEYNRMRILNGEANRVVDNSIWDGGGTMETSRNIVTTLFTSHQVPPGRLNYTIEQAGRSAMIELQPPPYGEVFDEDTAITINGNRFTTGGKTWAQVRAEINEQAPFMGITLYSGTGVNEGNYFLVTNLAGSNQSITVTGDLDTVGLIGLSVTDTGRDARVSTANPLDAAGNRIILDGETEPVIGGLLDINGNPISGASLGDSISGNNVTLRGSRGEEIRFNVQVMFDPESGEFVFPGGGGSIDALNDNPLHMTKDFRTFGPIMLQIGPNHNTAMPVQIPRLNAETLGLVQYVGGQRRQVIDLRPVEIIERRGAVIQVGAEAALAITDAAIETVSQARARLGAYQNRLESTVRNLDVAAENTEQSRSRIQDTDMARESTRFAQFNVMFQAALAIMGQANQRPQQVLALLQ